MLDLVGVWRLIASYVVVEGTGERTELLGHEPYAYAIFEPGGRMMVIGHAKNRTPATSTAAMAELFRSMVAYSGKWSIDSEKFVTEVDIAADPGWVGTTQGSVLHLQRTNPVSPNGSPEASHASWSRGRRPRGLGKEG